MFSQFGMIVALERSMLVVKVQNGLYNSNSLQQNSLEVLESCAGMLLKVDQTRKIIGDYHFFHGSFLRWRLYEQYFAVSMRGSG